MLALAILSAAGLGLVALARGRKAKVQQLERAPTPPAPVAAPAPQPPPMPEPVPPQVAATMLAAPQPPPSMPQLPEAAQNIAQGAATGAAVGQGLDNLVDQALGDDPTSNTVATVGGAAVGIVAAVAGATVAAPVAVVAIGIYGLARYAQDLDKLRTGPAKAEQVYYWALDEAEKRGGAAERLRVQQELLAENTDKYLAWMREPRRVDDWLQNFNPAGDTDPDKYHLLLKSARGELLGTAEKGGLLNFAGFRWDWRRGPQPEPIAPARTPEQQAAFDTKMAAQDARREETLSKRPAAQQKVERGRGRQLP